MSVLPATGAERRRLFLMIAVLAVASAILYWQMNEPAPQYPTTTGPPPSSNVTAGARAGQQSSAAAAVPQTPQALKFPELEQVPAEPKPGRNLFRFGVPPPPPPPPVVERPIVAPPPPAPTPTGPPPIPLRVVTLVPDPYQSGRVRVYLRDPQTNTVFEALEGEIVDGRYRVIKVGTTSVVMSYLDGSGQRTLPIGG